MNFRLDQLASLYLAYPLKRHMPSARLRIPILMYHNVSEPQENHLHPYFRTTTSPQIFAEQMNYLHVNGYVTVGIGEAVRRLKNGWSASAPCVAITFDDGYRDLYRQAFPILNRYGFSATVFVPTAYIGEQPVQFRGKECLTWGEIRELREAGVRF